MIEFYKQFEMTPDKNNEMKSCKYYTNWIL